LNSAKSTLQQPLADKTGEVIFIILTSANKSRAVCDIVEKYIYQEKRILLAIEDAHEAKKFDQLLWTWKQASFIPHVYLPVMTEKTEEPVVITSKVEKNTGFEVLIMVNPVAVEVMQQFQTVIDFAEKYNLVSLNESRRRYKELKKKNIALNSMHLGQFLSLKK
jgi:DNA polymerase-3 subunit chi